MFDFNIWFCSPSEKNENFRKILTKKMRIIFFSKTLQKKFNFYFFQKFNKKFHDFFFGPNFDS